jgi:chromosomal replication initiator protein
VTLPRRVAPDAILRAVAVRYGLESKDLRRRDGRHAIVHPRQIAMYLMRTINGNSFPWIGRYFGGKNHATVIYACRMVDAQRAVDMELEWVIRGLIEELTGKRAA